MLSVKGTYENGKIRLLEPIDIEEETEVIITFLDDSSPFSETDEEIDMFESAPDDDLELSDDDHSEAYYESMRQHKRYRANGDISITSEAEDIVFPLYDYSAGGLSFIADQTFEIGMDITATLKYSVGEDELVMDFEMTVRGVFEESAGQYKIGCQFFDQVDEQLWHTIMSD